MRVLIIHLSDIHVRGGTDVILGRVPQIVAAIRNIDRELSAVVIAVTGDIAFSGQTDQYLQASLFIEQLRTHFADALLNATTGRRTPVYIVMVPGNHDCNLSGDQTARYLIADAIVADSSRAKEPSIQSLALEPQSNFFQFRNLFDEDQYSSSVAGVYDSRIFTEFRLQIESVFATISLLQHRLADALARGSGRAVFPS